MSHWKSTLSVVCDDDDDDDGDDVEDDDEEDGESPKKRKLCFKGWCIEKYFQNYDYDNVIE